jgi:glycosyltransferase involved in cell wall biosynthesis
MRPRGAAAATGTADASGGSVRRRTAIVLFGVAASGTERRMAYVFTRLRRRHPGEYLLVINCELHAILERAGFGLGEGPDVRVLTGRSRLDVKRGAHPGLVVNAGRVLTLFRYRAAIARIVREEGIDTLQVFLEMVPFLGVFPVRGVRAIASLVSHLPEYYDRRRPKCRLLRWALGRYDRVDAIYESVATRLLPLGVPPEKIFFPRRNTVDHERFHPVPKDRAVSFTGRLFAFKNPFLMLDVAERVVRQVPDVHFHILGQGPLADGLEAEVKARRLEEQVNVGYLPDPSPTVNRSLIHLSIESFDNATNQSLLEGMASGCAIVASNAGATGTVVTDDVGVLTGLVADEIADATTALLARPDLVARLGAAARQKILAEHHVDTYLDYLRGVHDFGTSTEAVPGIGRDLDSFEDVKARALPQ